MSLLRVHIGQRIDIFNRHVDAFIDCTNHCRAKRQFFFTKAQIFGGRAPSSRTNPASFDNLFVATI